jgi:hypothetical protein
VQAGDDQSIFLSTAPATSRDRNLALAVVGVSSILFACAVPFAGTPLTPVPAFVASYQSALAANDLITAVLLYSQFAILRSRALLLLASGYLFTAAAALAHAVTFPGLFAPAGLLGGGSQTTVWLYMIWHGGFPLLVLGYALQRDDNGGALIKGSVSRAVSTSIITVVAAILAMVLLATVGHGLLPTLLSEGRYTTTMIVVVSAVWLICLATLLILWLRRSRTLLRRLADGRAVLVAVRHRVVGHGQRGPVRPRLLCRPAVRALRGELRTGDAFVRQCRPSGAVGSPARHPATAGRLRTRASQ